MDTAEYSKHDLEKQLSLSQSFADTKSPVAEIQPAPFDAKRMLKERLKFFISRDFLRVLFLGQLLALCITGTTITSTKLGNDFNFNAPTTQTFLVYAVLAIMFNGYSIWKRGIRGWAMQFWERGVFYFFLGWVDVEGNYLVVKSYQYTGMLSVMLLDSWSTPVCVILSYIFMRYRYRWIQYLGIIVSLGGMGLLVANDAMKGGSWMASDPVKGNLFCILGATFYGISNTSVEYLARKYTIYEVTGSFTLFATLINLVQLMILERNEFSSFVGNAYAVGLVIIYTVCMVVLYSLCPVMFRWGNAVLYNLSLMTSDFYSLIFGIGLFGYTVGFLYPIAYVVIILGIAIYFIFPAPQPVIDMEVDPTKPKKRRAYFGFWVYTVQPDVVQDHQDQRPAVSTVTVPDEDGMSPTKA